MLANGQLINALPNACPVADTIYAVYPETAIFRRKVRAVIDHLVTVFEGDPPLKRNLAIGQHESASERDIPRKKHEPETIGKHGRKKSWLACPE